MLMIDPVLLCNISSKKLENVVDPENDNLRKIVLIQNLSSDVYNSWMHDQLKAADQSAQALTDYSTEEFFQKLDIVEEKNRRRYSSSSFERLIQQPLENNVENQPKTVKNLPTSSIPALPRDSSLKKRNKQTESMDKKVAFIEPILDENEQKTQKQLKDSSSFSSEESIIKAPTDSGYSSEEDPQNQLETELISAEMLKMILAKYDSNQTSEPSSLSLEISSSVPNNHEKANLPLLRLDSSKNKKSLKRRISSFFFPSSSSSTPSKNTNRIILEQKSTATKPNLNQISPLEKNDTLGSFMLDFDTSSPSAFVSKTKNEELEKLFDMNWGLSK